MTSRPRIAAAVVALVLASSCGWCTLEGRAMNRRVEIITRPDETLAAESGRQAPSPREAPPAEEPR